MCSVSVCARAKALMKNQNEYFSHQFQFRIKSLNAYAHPSKKTAR